MSGGIEPLQLLPADEYEADEKLDSLTRFTRRLRAARKDRSRLGVRVDLGFRGERFVAPWKTKEQFFRQGSGLATLEVADPDLQRFVARWASGPLCYGYPSFVNQAGHVLPLLYCDVRLRIGSQGAVQIELERDSRPHINPRVMMEHGFDRSLTDDLVSDLLSRNFEDFDACLELIAKLLGLEDHGFLSEHLSGWQLDDHVRGWHNSPILFVPVDEPGQINIADELLTIEETIRDAVRHTALHAFFDDSPGSVDRPVPPLEPFLADSGRDKTLDACLSKTLSFLTAPPGTGRLPIIGNLIASQISAGGSVLFVSPHGYVSDQVVSEMQAVLQRSGTWIHRLEQRTGSADLSRSFDSQPTPDIGEVLAAADRRIDNDGIADRRTTVARDHLKEANDQLSALHQAQWRYSVARTEAASHLIDVDTQWHPLFAHDHDITAERSSLEALLDRVEKISTQPKRQGFARFLGRQETSPAFDDIVRDIISALSLLPRAVAEPMEKSLAQARDDGEKQPLIDAIKAVMAFQPWKAALVRADEAKTAIEQMMDVRTLVRHFTAAQAVIKKTERTTLSEDWNERIQSNLAPGADSLREFLKIVEERKTNTRRDEWLDRRLIQTIRKSFAAMPFWTGRPDNIVGRLPLDAALFDLVIIEDAQAIDAGALFPLLYRARQAVVIGTRPPAQHHKATAAGLLNESSGYEPVTMRDCARGHPEIVQTLSENNHQGKLRPLVKFRALMDGMDPTLGGVHWHPSTNSAGGFVADAQADQAINLIETWYKDGLLEKQPARMIGIVCPSPQRRQILVEALPKKVPERLAMERIAIAGPERFHSQVVDLLIVIPSQDGEQGGERTKRLAQSRLLYHDALAAAKIGVHIVADREQALEDGDLLGALAQSTAPQTTQLDQSAQIQAGVKVITSLFEEAGIAYMPAPRGLIAFGPLGTCYEFVVPGGHHLPSAEDPNGELMAIHLFAEDLDNPVESLTPFIERLA